jgi:alpha-L-arabinofuranosidase
MRNIIILVILFIALSEITAQDNIYKAEVTISKEYKTDKIDRKIHGGFFEFDEDFMIGKLSMSAEELINRGFDLEKYELGTTRYWNRYFTLGIPEEKIPQYMQDSVNKYNNNGKYAQVIINTFQDNLAGLSQESYISEAGSDFYIYLKSDTEQEVFLRLTDPDDDKIILFEESLGKADSDWLKHSIEIPKQEGIYTVKLIIYTKDQGSLYLDEASLLPKDHVNYFRKEYFDLYNLWKPGIIRYPGGSFADEWAARWEYGIGHRDLRNSPNLFDGRIQRLEIGTDEFIWFCDYIGAEAQLVANMKIGSASESAGWVEYCNGNEDTHYGSLRIENGHPVPYDVKYWEIGNEQWYDAKDMSDKFKAHAIEMLSVDDDLEFIMGGNLWGFYDFFETTMNIAGDYFQYYGWHYLHFVDERLFDDTTTYIAIQAGYQGNQRFYNYFRDWRNQYGNLSIKLAVTELWTAYEHLGWFYGDRLFSHENGLWNADQIMQSFENADILKIVNRTSNSGMFNRGFDSKGKRIITPSPSLYTSIMLSNHSGDYYHETSVISPTFSIEHDSLMWAEYDMPWLRAVTTSDEDSLYIAVINKHHSKDCEFTINFELNDNAEIKHYELFSENFLDFNTPDEPYKISPKTNDIVFNKSDNFFVKKHSFNIFSISKKYLTDSNYIEPDKNIKIYPNPTKRFVNLSNLPNENLEIRIVNSIGRTILTEKSNYQENLFLDLLGLDQGIYFIVINDDNFKNSPIILIK